jgi:hypothetical protein
MVARQHRLSDLSACAALGLRALLIALFSLASIGAYATVRAAENADPGPVRTLLEEELPESLPHEARVLVSARSLRRGRAVDGVRDNRKAVRVANGVAAKAANLLAKSTVCMRC